MQTQKLVGTENGIKTVSIGKSYVILKEYDKNYYKVEHNFNTTNDGSILNKTKEYVKIVNTMISITKFSRGKIERAIATGYLKVKNHISNETLNYIGDFLAEWYKDNKTTYQNIEKLEKIDKSEVVFIKKDLSIEYYIVEYNKTKQKLYNYGRKHLFINGFTPVEDFIDIIEDVFQNSVLLALELNKPIEVVFYKLFNKEMRFLQKSEKKFKYLSELVEKEDKQQEILDELGYVDTEDLNDGLTD